MIVHPGYKIKILRIHLVNASGLQYTCIADHHIQSAEFQNRLINRFLNRFQAGHIGFHKPGPVGEWSAHSAHSQGHSRLLINIHDHHIGPSRQTAVWQYLLHNPWLHL